MVNEKRLIYAVDAMKWIRESKVPETGAFTKGINKGLNIALSTLGNNEVLPTVDAVEVKHGWWEDGRCSNCQEEALSTSWDEPIYDYDWEENLRYSHTETHTEYQLTNYCPNCGAKMDGDGNG